MKDSFLQLGPSELRRLAAAIQSGRLRPPYDASALQRIVNTDIAVFSAQRLGELADTGAPPAAVARTLELLAEAQEQRPTLDQLVELVTTGPEKGGVANRDTRVVVHELFQRAETSVLVAGYAVYQGRRIFEALAGRMRDNAALRSRFFLDIPRKAGDTSAPAEIVRRFAHDLRQNHWPGDGRLPELFYDPRALAVDRAQAASLHAKCVVVDGRDVFVSSANFTEAAQERNIEVGLLLHSPVLAERIVRFFESLVQGGHFQRVL